MANNAAKHPATKTPKKQMDRCPPDVEKEIQNMVLRNVQKIAPFERPLVNRATWKRTKTDMGREVMKSFQTGFLHRRPMARPRDMPDGEFFTNLFVFMTSYFDCNLGEGHLAKILPLVFSPEALFRLNDAFLSGARYDPIIVRFLQGKFEDESETSDDMPDDYDTDES